MVRRRAAKASNETTEAKSQESSSLISFPLNCSFSLLRDYKYRSLSVLVLAWCSVALLYSNFELPTWFSTASTSNTKRLERRRPGELRLDWAHLEAKSEIARLFQQQRLDCSLPLRFHKWGDAGLGAELHGYTYSMCLAHQYGYRLYSVHNMYYDETLCANYTTRTLSQLACYFNRLELQCPKDEEQAQHQQQSKEVKKYKLDYWNLWKDHQRDNICQSILNQTSKHYDNIQIRSAAMEAMFTAGISPQLLREAQRQHALVFPQGPPPSAQLITVHIRWGDKRREMPLVHMPDYIKAIQSIAQSQNLTANQVHIYLATEDPSAVYSFQQHQDPQWTVYLDRFYTEMLPHRNNLTQEVAAIARAKTVGRLGVLALGSLLVAMEANHYVLTSASNWSRLMNELRRTIVRTNGCGNATTGGDCTSVVDLRKADFWMDLDDQGNGV